MSVDVTDQMALHCGTVRVYVAMSGLITVTDDGDITFINDRFSRMFLGYGSNVLVGKVCCSVFTLLFVQNTTDKYEYK